MGQDTEITPVLFCKSEGEITAVFPTLPADGYNMTCYAHIGQHSGCSLDWLRSTKKAAPHEYADLLRELEQIGYRLKIYKRLSIKLQDELRANRRRQP